MNIEPDPDMHRERELSSKEQKALERKRRKRKKGKRPTVFLKSQRTRGVATRNDSGHRSSQPTSKEQRRRMLGLKSPEEEAVSARDAAAKPATWRGGV